MKYEYQGLSKMTVQHQTVFKKGQFVEVTGKFSHPLFKPVDETKEKKPDSKKETQGEN